MAGDALSEAIFLNRLGAENFRATRPMGSLGLLYLVSDRPQLAWARLAETERILAATDHTGAELDRVLILRRMALAASRMQRPAEASELSDLVLELSGNLEADQRAAAYLLRAWLSLVRNERQAAEQAMNQAMSLAVCDDLPCTLDRADEWLTRAHWLARFGDADAALLALEPAVGHPMWTSWLLNSPDFSALHADPRW